MDLTFQSLLERIVVRILPDIAEDGREHGMFSSQSITPHQDILTPSIFHPHCHRGTVSRDSLDVTAEQIFVYFFAS